MKHTIKLIAANLLVSLGGLTAAEPSKPNIVYILCDDLGYGDVHCLNPERGKIATPQIDKMAAEGMIFTDAHTSSSVCTPTRYGILTGRYNWRTRLQSGVLNGFSEPLIRKGSADGSGAAETARLHDRDDREMASRDGNPEERRRRR